LEYIEKKNDHSNEDKKQKEWNVELQLKKNEYLRKLNSEKTKKAD
jgi:hypothetical protein